METKRDIDEGSERDRLRRRGRGRQTLLAEGQEDRDADRYRA